ncbi:ninja-family protein AFP3-like [Salvia miltiorrhiza]|uniref:ninja-family protein AFP3-like n=1 Tax=Salvia miltiorrhiza TaxID=226208 RepID=UPI0025ABBA40|nr:ninja-family protein AFP3-like [Salvia miltiorrhiza]
MEGDEDNTRRFLGADGTSKDPMHKSAKRTEREREEKEELELSLGLSTNGRFGVDLASKKMRRSSSVSNIVLLNIDCAGDDQARGADAPLARTCSLPPAFDSGGRTRTRMEKLKSVDGGDGVHADAGLNADMARDGIRNLRLKEWPKPPIESRGDHSHIVKGATQTTMTGSSCSGGGPTVLVANTDEAQQQNALVDMPYVSTKGFGPNHNKIEGFLYRYKRGEEVKIVCVCHGMFLSPAEFVKHGGGGDVAYPLKHIVVNPFPLY